MVTESGAWPIGVRLPCQQYLFVTADWADACCGGEGSSKDTCWQLMKLPLVHLGRTLTLLGPGPSSIRRPWILLVWVQTASRRRLLLLVDGCLNFIPFCMAWASKQKVGCQWRRCGLTLLHTTGVPDSIDKLHPGKGLPMCARQWPTFPTPCYIK